MQTTDHKNIKTVVCIALISENDQILISKRPPKKHLPGFWEFPGGKVEVNELPENALIREFKEELNVDIEVNSFITKFSNTIITLKAYSVSLKPNQDLINLEHQKLGWFTLDEAIALKLGELDKAIVEHLAKLK